MARTPKPVSSGEDKNIYVSVTLTPSDVRLLDAIALDLRLTRSTLAALIICEELDNRRGRFTTNRSYRD